MLGTPNYMAPEQFAGRAATAHSDQYSFCVALFEALHGRRPFTGDTLAMHVAIARHVPTVVLFGPTSLHEIDVFDRGERIAAEGMDCLCCYLPDCDVRPTCMDNIATDRVFDAVTACLALPAARS